MLGARSWAAVPDKAPAALAAVGAATAGAPPAEGRIRRPSPHYPRGALCRCADRDMALRRPGILFSTRSCPSADTKDTNESDD
jgi:hypothetical protein